MNSNKNHLKEDSYVRAMLKLASLWIPWLQLEEELYEGEKFNAYHVKIRF